MGGAVEGDGLYIWGLDTCKREEKTFLPPPPYPISFGGLGAAASRVFHPNAMVYFYLFRKTGIRSQKMDHPHAGLQGLEGTAVRNIATERRLEE